ncbi:Acl4p ASCRUDRAFT_75308, partial [Ascoidea rubescens DSM 1968]
MDAKINKVISLAKEYLSLSEPKKALKILLPYIKNSKFNQDLDYLNILGEVFLETNNLEKAYEVFEKACKIDPEANHSVDYFFNWGQIIGGFDALKLFDIAISKLENQISKTNVNQNIIIKKLVSGYLSSIEIWMTELCFEEAAEKSCESLINKAIQIDPSNPEIFSMNASIKVSQQNYQVAKESILKSWELFQAKIESLQTNDSLVFDSINHNLEYIELIQPFTTLARLAIEMELYETASSIASSIHDINEDIVEPYYLECFANYLQIKLLQNPQNDNYQDSKLILNDNNVEITKLINETRASLVTAKLFLN